MPLPSQSARPIARRTHMHRQSRNRRTPKLFAFIAFVAVVLIAWAVWPRGESGSPDSAAGADRVAAAVSPRGVDAERATGEMSNDTAGDAAERQRGRATPPVVEKTTIAAPPTVRMPDDTTETPTARSIAAPPPPETRTASSDNPARPAVKRPDAGSSTPAAPVTGPSGGSAPRAERLMHTGLDLLARNEPVEGRRVLTQALESDGLDARDADIVRRQLTEVNKRLVFSPEIVEGDPFVISYSVQDNDLLSRIPRTMGVQVEWQFLQKINRIGDPRRIRGGQRLKVVTGPFSAVVHKRRYQMDVYMGEGADRVFVCTFDVGLGEYNSTPEGRFRVRSRSKLVNPEWRNPRTRRLYLPDDPENPIGEHWIGLVGDEEHLADVAGYGIHGTIEPESIGRQASMGCVRMLPEDVEFVWGMLLEDVSTVEIRP